MLPYEPEPIESLRRRYPAAIRKVYDTDAMLRGERPRPGELRQHMFDFEHGLRLLVSRDKSDGHPPYIRFSASIGDGSLLELAMEKKHVGIETFLTMATMGYRTLSGDSTPFTYLGRSENGIPRWARPDKG